MPSRTSTEGLRHQNRAVVLRSLRAMGAGSHTEIAEFSGLASGTVSVITGELLQEGALKKIEQAPASGRGRPRVMFTMQPDFATLALIRIASSVVEYSLINYGGILVDRFSEPRDNQSNDPKSFEIQLRQGMDRLIERNGGDPDHVVSVSVSTKGIVSADKSKLLWSPVFDETEFDFNQILSPEWAGRVTISHETGFSAMGCLERSDQIQNRHVVLSLGDTIGLGIAERHDNVVSVLAAPPIAHMVHEPNGPVCRCGDMGCVEAYAGFYGILRTAFDAPAGVIPAKFIPIEQMVQLADQARKGDRKIEFAFRQAGHVLGMALSRLFTLYGPMPVTVAGPGVIFYDLLTEGMQSQLSKNLQVRVNERPQFQLEANEPLLVYESNKEQSLQRFDTDVVARRLMERKQIA